MGLRTFLGIKKRTRAIQVQAKPVKPDWFAEIEISRDWTSHNFRNWDRLLPASAAHILEIGSLEGCSANYFLRRYSDAIIACIDPFKDSKVESLFDRNTAPFASRVEKIKSRSVPALDRLIVLNRKFDLIYIDGDHSRHAVAADSILAWELLTIGGTMIWDDYRWNWDWPDEKIPRSAIDLFLEAFRDCIEIKLKDYQVIAVKTASWPE